MVLSAQIATDSEAEAVKQTDSIRLGLIAAGEWPQEGRLQTLHTSLQSRYP